MPRFKYRFERILAYRGHLEKQKQRELAEVRKLEQDQHEMISGIFHTREAIQAEQRGWLKGRLDPRRLTGYSRYYLKLKQLEVGSREALHQIGIEAEKRRRTLVEATRQKKILEKLRERYLNRYRYETNLARQKEDDEAGQQVFLRNN